jgi:hypothetical protein
MKIASIRFLTAMLFSAIAIVPLPAQTNAPVENATNQPTAVTDNSSIPAGGQNAARVKVPGLEAYASGKPAMEEIVAIVGFFGVPVAIVAIMFYTIHLRNKLVHETIRAMVEKGIPMTPELIASVKPKGSAANFQVKVDGGSTRTRHLLPGLILVGAGLGGMVIDMRWALIILLVGVAFLIVWLVERKQHNTEPPKS